MKKIIGILSALILFSGCSTSRFSISFQEPGFNIATLKTTPIVIVGGPTVTLKEFKKSYNNVYNSDAAFMIDLTRKLWNGFGAAGFDVSTNNSIEAYNSIQNPSSNFTTKNNAKIAICIRNVTIDEVIQQGAAQPGMPATRTSSCSIDIFADIIDLSSGKLLTSLSAGENAGVSFFAYETALRDAIDKACGLFVNSLSGGNGKQ
ncbi:MAG: hypothetical protein JNL74_05740 [Fibrobacteres bacterium]|nr:hypothetical protein [Fibrobacterota bacterium]